jgi:Zn-finger protein
MSENELCPCPFCDVNEWKYQSHFSGTTIYQCEKCGTIVEEWVINIRPIEDALNARIAELERDKKALRGIEENLREHIDIGTRQLSVATARIAELEAENTALKQHPQPIEFWSDEKKELYRRNESRTIKSGREEECEE